MMPDVACVAGVFGSFVRSRVFIDVVERESACTAMGNLLACGLGPGGSSSFRSACFCDSNNFMAKSIRVIKKTRGRPKTTGTGTLIGVRMSDNTLERLDGWAGKQDGEPSRPEAIRRLVEIGLGKK